MSRSFQNREQVGDTESAKKCTKMRTTNKLEFQPHSLIIVQTPWRYRIGKKMHENAYNEQARI